MKKFLFVVLALLSVSSFAKVEINSLSQKKEFEQYLIQSDKAGTVVVNVDVETIRVDCHGLRFRYGKEVLSNGDILITKEALMHTMQMCRPNTDYVATTGISFKVAFKNKTGGYQLLLVPDDAKVSIQTK